METKKMAVIMLKENKKLFLEKAAEYEVKVYNYYRTKGSMEGNIFRAICFIVSGSNVGDLICDMTDAEEFGM